jgi:Ca2+-binding RTX toxin-like protein
MATQPGATYDEYAAGTPSIHYINVPHRNYHMDGGDGGDLLLGDAGNDLLLGGGGDDLLLGEAGDDLLLGDDGNDILLGGTGHDRMLGGAGDDVLLGGAGDDVLIGGTGNDVLYGGAGNDVMHGGAGDDVFLFSGGGGQDVILDFSAGNDLLQIVHNVNGTGIASPDDLVGRVCDSEFGATIDLGQGDSVTLANVRAEDVEADPSAYVSIV